MDQFEDLNGTQTRDMRARPATTKVIKNPKKHQTTRIIMNAANMNQMTDFSMKPPKPSNNVKTLALNKLSSIKRIVSAAVKDRDPPIAGANKENVNSNIIINNKDPLMRQADKAFEDYIKQQFMKGE